MEQSGTLLHDPTTKEISGVLWQNIDQEEVKMEFGDGSLVRFSASSTLEMHPVLVVLGGGDAEWVSCALGKEHVAGAHCMLTAIGQNNNFTSALENSGHLRPWQQRLGPSKTKHCQLSQLERTSPLATMEQNILQHFASQFTSGFQQFWMAN
jgi:hypothetical protein